jgi:hypothetical protein
MPSQDRSEAEEDPPELGFFVRVLIYIAGADPDFVLKNCPEDIGKLTAAGIIAVGAFLYNSTVFITVATHLAGHFSGGLVAGGIGLAACILATDSFIFFRCAHLLSGFEQLAQAGLQVAIPLKVRKMVRRALGMRIGQSCCLGLVVGVMASLVIYSGDIAGRMQLDSLRTSSAQVRQLSEQTDSDAKRVTQEITSTTTNINLLNKQIGAALARSANAANSPQLRALEVKRNAEENKLAAQKAELSRLQSGRNERLRAGLDGDPTVVHTSGVLAQISALEELAGDDWKIAFVILLVELLAMGFDLAPVLAKMNYLPTTYSVLLARDYLERMQRTVDEMVPPEPDPNGQVVEIPANDDDPFGGAQAVNDNIAPEPLKRKRGRPRKHPLTINGTGLMVREEPPADD